MSRLIACSCCGRIHQRGYICEPQKKRATEYERKRRTRNDVGIYKSSLWERARADILEQYHHICLYSFYVENKIVLATDVHHIIEILDDDSLAYEEDNLIPLNKEKHRLIHVYRRHY